MDTYTPKKRKILTVLIISLFSFCLYAPLSFAETRQHEAHVHGVGTLNIAVTDTGMYVELDSPAMNMLGFEHAPGNAEQEQALNKIKEQLRDGQSLFMLPAEAGCQLIEVEVEHKALMHDHEEHHDHAQHVHHDHDQDAHDEHDDHGDHDGEHYEHSEFHGLYQFSCATPEQLTSVDVQLFALFPGLERLDVQLLTPEGQTARELTAQNHVINW